MRCEWCPKRDALYAGKPHVGPVSAMCEGCSERVCRRDDKGQPIRVPIAEYQKDHPKWPRG